MPRRFRYGAAASAIVAICIMRRRAARYACRHARRHMPPTPSHCHYAIFIYFALSGDMRDAPRYDKEARRGDAECARREQCAIYYAAIYYGCCCRNVVRQMFALLTQRHADAVTMSRLGHTLLLPDAERY